jgi:hypothetical protein
MLNVFMRVSVISACWVVRQTLEVVPQGAAAGAADAGIDPAFIFV